MNTPKSTGMEDRDEIIRSVERAENAMLDIERIICKNHPHPGNGFTIVLIHTIIRILRGLSAAASGAYEPSTRTFDAEFYDLEVPLWFPKGVEIHIKLGQE